MAPCWWGSNEMVCFTLVCAWCYSLNAKQPLHKVTLTSTKLFFSTLDTSYDCRLEGAQAACRNPVRRAAIEVCRNEKNCDLKTCPLYFISINRPVLLNNPLFLKRLFSALRYRIDFRSSVPVERLHAFVGSGEVCQWNYTDVQFFEFPWI